METILLTPTAYTAKVREIKGFKPYSMSMTSTGVEVKLKRKSETVTYHKGVWKQCNDCASVLLHTLTENNCRNCGSSAIYG